MTSQRIHTSLFSLLFVTAACWGCTSVDRDRGPKACSGDGDCTATAPFCVAGFCAECRTGADCGGELECSEGACVPTGIALDSGGVDSGGGGSCADSKPGSCCVEGTTVSQACVGDVWACPTGSTPGACTTGPVCGNGVMEAGETCDDGNTDSGDGCDGSCQTEAPTCAGTPPTCCTEDKPPMMPAAECLDGAWACPAGSFDCSG